MEVLQIRKVMSEHVKDSRGQFTPLSAIVNNESTNVQLARAEGWGIHRRQYQPYGENRRTLMSEP